MSQCAGCQKCSQPIDFSGDAPGGLALVGNLNVGKSTLFGRLRGKESRSINIPGTTLSVRSGKIKGSSVRIYDTPGIYSLFSSNEDERASRDLLLLPKVKADVRGIILVADAKNLKRSLAIALQYAEYGLPMVMDVNMVDEAASRGIEIDFTALSELLGIRVVTTVAREGMGIDELSIALGDLRQPARLVTYPPAIESFLAELDTILNPEHLSARAIGLLLLTEDAGAEDYIVNTHGQEMLDRLRQLARRSRRESAAEVEISLSALYNQEAARLADQVQLVEPPSRNPLILSFGDWCTDLVTGIPIALAILVLTYLFVGSFGATMLVDTINGVFFEGMLIPWISGLVAHIPIPLVREVIIDPDFGVLPTGIFLALGLVMPVIFCFYIAFGILEDSGYLPRLSLLLDRVFQKIGLNGKGVIPLVMGFSCVTMAILTTRILATDKEKNIASFLLFLCMPCAPLMAVMLIILDKMPVSATITVFSLIFMQILVAGFLANMILPGNRTPLMMEIPAMRFPKPWPVVRMAAAKSYFFMKEAVPVFVMASLVVFFFQYAGGLDLLERFMGPVIGKVMGLPENSIQVFIKTMIRRESGAAELEHISASYTNLQLVVNLLVMTFVTPCLNAIMVLYKERGGNAATAIVGAVTVYAVVVGSLLNHFCQFFNITFS